MYSIHDALKAAQTFGQHHYFPCYIGCTWRKRGEGGKRVKGGGYGVNRVEDRWANGDGVGVTLIGHLHCRPMEDRGWSMGVRKWGKTTPPEVGRGGRGELTEMDGGT